MTTAELTLATVIVTSLTAIILAIINNRKLGVVERKADVIHQQTNSMNTVLTERNKAQQDQAVADAKEIGSLKGKK